MIPDVVPLYSFVHILAKRRQEPDRSSRALAEVEALQHLLSVTIKQAQNYAAYTLRQAMRSRVVEQSRLHNWLKITEALNTLDQERMMARLIHDSDWRRQLMESPDAVTTILEMWQIIGKGAG